METTIDTKGTFSFSPFDKGNSQLQNTLFQHSHHHELCIFSSNEPEPACCAHKSLWTRCHCRQCWNAPPTPDCSHPLFGLHKCSASIDGCVSRCHFFPHGGIQWHTFTSYVLPRQMPFGQTAPLLLLVTWQQHVTKYRQEASTSTAIPPTSTPDLMGQHNKTGGITFGAAHIKYII